MKTVSIRKLHEATGRVAREAQHEPILVTDRGKAIAMLGPVSAAAVKGKAFPHRTLHDLVPTQADSTDYVSEDRGE